MGREQVEAGWLDVEQLTALGTRVSPDVFYSAQQSSTAVQNDEGRRRA